MNDEDRLFELGSDAKPFAEAYYWTGRVADGRQLLFGRGDNEDVLVLWFDAEGRYSHLESFPVPRALDKRNEPGSYAQLMVEHLIAYQREKGCRPAPIRVRHFCIDEPLTAAIRLMDIWMLEFLCAPYVDPDHSDDDRRILLKSIARWQARGGFRLVWGGEEFDERVDEEAQPPDDYLERFVGWPPTSAAADRLYPLSGGEGTEFLTGTSAAGEQFLLGPYNEDELVCGRFDQSGRFLDSQVRELPPRPEEETESEDEPPGAWEAEQSAAWLRELGAEPAPIRVRKFHLPDERQVFINDYPNWAIILHYDPFYYPDPQERADLRRLKAEWESSGNFVFWWGNKDSHLGADGRLLST
jgi:hypothetical protein